MAGESVQLRSYREVFRLSEGRRLYSFGELRISELVPGGLPLRAVAYFLATLAAVALAGLLPGLGTLADLAPWQFRYLLFPAACAALGAVVAPDGRMAHRFALDWLRSLLRARRQVAGLPVPAEGRRQAAAGDLWSFPDASWPALRAAVVRGPCTVELPGWLEVSHAGRGLVAKPIVTEGQDRVASSAQRLELGEGERLRIAPRRRPR